MCRQDEDVGDSQQVQEGLEINRNCNPGNEPSKSHLDNWRCENYMGNERINLIK